MTDTPAAANTEAVFFDLDGTLIDTAPDMGGALNTVLRNHNRSTVAEATYRPQVSHGSIALLKLGFPELQSADDFQQLRLEFLAAYENDIARDSHLFSGMEAVLHTLEKQAIPWGIITNKPEHLTHKLLKLMTLFDRCCSIVSADTTTHAKPHPAPMLLACKRAGVTPENCLYIGDAKRDIDAGLAVGMTTLVANWGYICPQNDDPDRWNASAIVQHPQSILDHLTSTPLNH